MKPLRIFVGRDERQPVAPTVAVESLLAHSSVPLAITQLCLRTLPTRLHGLTSFTYSRYLVPYLCGFEGQALFMDGDMLCRWDIAQLFELSDGHAVSVVNHHRRFERPSLMLFNCEKNTILTPDYLNSGQNLSNLTKVAWTDDVGQLPHEWNHLVGYDEPDPNAKMVHFTQGIPCFKETEHDEHGAEWRQMAQRSVSTVPWDQIMGGSVHEDSVRKRAINQ